MKTTLIFLRALGVISAVTMLYGLVWSFSLWIPLDIEKIQSSFFRELLIFTYIPGAITFSLVLVPFRKLTSKTIWTVLYGLLTIGLTYWTVGVILTDTLPFSLFFTAMTLSQLYVLFILRPLRIGSGEHAV